VFAGSSPITFTSPSSKGLQREHGIPVIDVETGKASGIETDNLTFFTSWRIVTKVLDKYETVCSFQTT
jgi:hypothetical protein